ncbi:MAG: bifunctional phosphoglucose/phosphomannose isomerase [Patescibacteria group bacterium]
MMRDAILNFAKQFEFKPQIQNKKNFKKATKFAVIGMGGSHLAADLLLIWDPSLDIEIHRDYGLPKKRDLKQRLVILSSYSGNTEEVVSAFGEALVKKLTVAAVSVGGKLEQIAIKHGVPFIKMPDTNIQPRSALGFSLMSLMTFMGINNGLREAMTLAKLINPAKLEKQGKNIAQNIRDRVPVIYSSNRNLSIAYNWKIKFNETGKIPAFYNVIPELNHNEMNGFDVKDSSRRLSRQFYFIFLKDSADHPRVQKRMQITADLYKKRGLPVQTIELKGKNVFEKIFSSLVISDWAATLTAEAYGLESEQVPMIEEFKKQITK